jgi:tRNA pseudouridine38-40 synthase
MLVRVTLEYDGTNYSGWQIQSAQASIQGTIETALARIFAQKIRVYGAGRTDAGVHARGQVAAFRLPRPFDPVELMRALNALLPPDIVVLSAVPTDDSFNPRHARVRVYEYRVLNQSHRSAFEFRHSWLVREPLELDALNAAARAFCGEHDFAAFRSLGSDEKSTVRRIFGSEWRRDGSVLTYRVEATGFLRHMVRAMVATMIAAGRRSGAQVYIADLLAGADRARVPASAPACGLCLAEVRY